MTYTINAVTRSVAPPPIAEAARWLDDNRSGLKPINLSQAVPSYAPAEALASHAAQAILDGTATLYTDILGIAPLREELAGHMASTYGGAVNAEDVAITAGCNAAFCQAIMALAEPGDNVVLATPWYFNHQMWLQMQDIRPVLVPFIDAAGATLTPAMVEPLITPRTRAMVVVTPNNPTGAVHSADELAELYRLAAEHRIALIVDETYRDFLEDQRPPHRLFEQPDWRETFVQLYSFSKVYSLTGYRVGGLVAGPGLMEPVEKLLDTLTICPPHLGQVAALHGIEQLADFRAEKRALMAARAAAMRGVFQANDLGYRLAACGAYFAWVEHPFEGQPCSEVARRLADRHDLLCLPGSMFGPGQERYLRFAFANLEVDAMPLLGDRLRESLA